MADLDLTFPSLGVSTKLRKNNVKFVMSSIEKEETIAINMQQDQAAKNEKLRVANAHECGKNQGEKYADRLTPTGSRVVQGKHGGQGDLLSRSGALDVMMGGHERDPHSGMSSVQMALVREKRLL